MFGLNIVKTKDYDALRSELKGYYSNEEKLNEYLKIIAPQLKGAEMVHIANYTREQLKDAYQSIAPVMGVINYIADNVGEVSRYFELKDLKTGEFIEKHWILDLLRRPNDRFTRRKFFSAWAVNKCVFGDSTVYAPIEPGKDRNVPEMYIIPGQRIQIDRGGYDKPFKGVRLSGTNGEILLDDKVFQSFDYNLDDTSFYGTSRLAAAAVYLSVIEDSMTRQATALKNGGVANVITPAASSNVPPLASWLDDMEQKMNKKSNVNKNVTLKTAIDVHALGNKPVDLDILSSHKDAINVLCFVYKIPVDLYLGQAKYENAKEAKKTIYEQSAIPMCNEFGEDFIHYLGLDDQYQLSIDTDQIEVLKNSRGETLDDLAKMHASLNELREANGYERIEEDYADQPMLPLGVQFGNEMSGFDIDENA